MTPFVGRQQERQTIRTVLEARGPALVVVRGSSGVGKTALVDQALRDIADTAPIVGRAKYVEQTTSAGLTPVIDALSQAVDAALDRLYDPVAGAASLRDLLGVQFDTLLAAGFDVSGGEARTAPLKVSSLQGRDGTVRLVDAAVRVLQWLEGFALPVVLFIDDWHRAPNEAIGFVHACTHRPAASALKLVLAARSEGAMPLPPGARVIEMAPLDAAQQLQLLTGLFENPSKARAMQEWLGNHASGLPFELNEVALALDRARAFTGTAEALRVDPVRAAAIDHRDISQIIAQRTRALAPSVQRVGTAAALWGDRVDLDILARYLAEPYAAIVAAVESLQAHGLLFIEGGEAVFAHDRIRASLLGTPDNAALRGLAGAMADIALAEDGDAHRQTALRLKLLGGIDGGADLRLTTLFAAGAAAARPAAQFDLAAEFGEAAWAIFRRLGMPDGSERVPVLREACFAAAHRRQIDATRERSRLMIAAATNKRELAEAYERSVIAMRLAGRSADAWTFCREGFARFGIRLPDRVRRHHLLLATVAWKLLGRTPRPLIRGDAATEQAVTSFANAAAFTVWERSPHHSAYLSSQLATRARLRGEDSAQWQSIDSMICAVLKDYLAAAELGDKALAGVEDLPSGRGMTLHRAIYFGKMWRDPCATLIAHNRRIYDFSIAEGNLVMAANAAVNEMAWTWRTAPTLETTVAKIEETDAKAKRLDDPRVAAAVGLVSSVIGRLQRPEPLPRELPAEFSQDKIGELPTIMAAEYWSLAGDWPAIVRLADQFRSKRASLDSHPMGVSWRFYENLARLKTGLAPDRADLRFIERAARANPTDQLGKLLLLSAEALHRQGARDGLLAYGAAVEALRKGFSSIELGLGAECAAQAAHELGDTAAQERFRAIATATWSSWGAFAKLAPYKADDLDASVRARLAEAEAQVAVARRGERAKSRFLAEVGHELRTPLQAMQGLLDLAAERPGEVDLGEMRDVFGSLKSVVEDLTELGALGAEAPLRTRPTDLAVLLRSELQLVRETARQKGLDVTADLAPLDGRTYELDADRLRQVVRNLLSNAVKYTPRGTVSLRAGIEETASSGARIALAVEDTGPGIPEERLAHLFEPFDRAGRNDPTGLGLGLSLARRIAGRMGGALVAENRRDGGARFVFTFIAAERDSCVASPAPARRLSILIVEDTALVRRLMARLLVLDGHDVREAETLADGLAAAAMRPFDLLLLDLQLPDGDGLLLLDRWPAGRGRPPVVVTTAAVTRETEERVQRAGAAILRKPIAAADLRAAIAAACGSAQAPAPASPAFDIEMAQLEQDAQREIAERAQALIALMRSGGARETIHRNAHKLAGMAAQFDAPRIAEAADEIEQACIAEGTLGHALAGLERAVDTARPTAGT
ncbi:MAG: response regulator [Proteobacteria bacterium]|nr:response regulator [Pseudomonadota bacterium]